MRKYIVIIYLVCLTLSMPAIQITFASQNSLIVSYDTLNKEDLAEFSTVRNKNGKDIKETWRGISLLLWLDKLGYSNWHTLKCVSSDAYEVKLHRTELDAMPAFLALVHEGDQIAESDLRVIFPTTRENLWLRGVSKIELEPFVGVPHPKQIFSWEDYQAKLDWNKNGLNIGKLINQAFYQNKGTLVVVDAKLHAMALDFPEQLSKAAISKDDNGALRLLGVTLRGYMQLEEIIYLQVGPYAYVKQEYRKTIPDIAKALLWERDNITYTEMLGVQSKLLPSDYKSETDSSTWIELD